METIFTSNAPKPAGHYSQAVIHNGIIYVAGQVPIDPKTNEKITGRIEEQAGQVFKNLNEILIASGSDLNHVLKTTIYIPDIALWDRVNKIYIEFFGNHKPARTVVPTNALHYGFLIEVDAIAAIIK
jgi:2-iminobutanoate/2-iminopropanoate deaminase